MVYIYDILLNFNKECELYDFFEWEMSDNIVHVKKIPIFKTSTRVLEEISSNGFRIAKDFLLKIKNVSELYCNKKVEKLLYACIFTDGSVAMAFGFNSLGNIIFKSKMLIDEEDEAIDIAEKLSVIQFEYELNGKKFDDSFLTRNDKSVKRFLQNEIKESYKVRDLDKLKYIYVEYFDNNKDDINLIYRELIRSLEIGVNDKHNNIYNLLKLACSRK